VEPDFDTFLDLYRIKPANITRILDWSGSN